MLCMLSIEEDKTIPKNLELNTYYMFPYPVLLLAVLQSNPISASNVSLTLRLNCTHLLSFLPRSNPLYKVSGTGG